MRYLFIESHIDDNVLSCGGFISKLIEEGHQVSTISLSQEYAHPILKKVNTLRELIASMEVLGVPKFTVFNYKTREFYKSQNEILQSLFDYNDFDFIVTHDSTDVHSDHSVVGHCAKRAFKNKNLICYKATWNSRTITHNYFVKLKKGHIENKIKALACYESQQHRTYMSADYIWANARNMGVMAGCEFAEGFEVVNLYDS